MSTQRKLIAATLATMLAFHAIAKTHYVNVTNASPVSPYTNWATAATVIQDAIDAAQSGDFVLVTNGVYQTGARVVSEGLPNRVVVDKPISLQSVNGPDSTVIVGSKDPDMGGNGDGAVRCIFVVHGATVAGFTLKNGATRQNLPFDVQQAVSGGGAYCPTDGLLSNCVFVGNSADRFGGGVYGGVLHSCIVSNNLSANSGGGSFNSALQHCTITKNSALGSGGGVSDGAANDCDVIANYSSNFGGGIHGGSHYNCRIAFNRSGNIGGGVEGSLLDGCTLIGNTAPGDTGYGGGAYNAVAKHCRFYTNSAAVGGGACQSQLSNCLIIGNSAIAGGGVSDEPISGIPSTVINCTIVGNTGTMSGGGAINSVLYNSIIFHNTGPMDPDCSACAEVYCCTSIQPDNGVGNITAEPLFVNWPAGDLHLQAGSPCIDAGANSNAPAGLDLDGNPRIVGGIVDIGAYEYVRPSLTPLQLWLQSYGLPTDGSADYSDSDGDGMNNWQEWRCGTNPTNALSLLRLFALSTTKSSVILSWESVAGVNYFLERSTNPISPTSFIRLAIGVPGQLGLTSYTDTNVTGAGSVFYRVGVGD